MKFSACILSKKNIPCYHNVLNHIHNSKKPQLFCLIAGIHNASCCKIFVFTISKYRNINICCQSHCLSCNSCIHYRSSIFTYRYRTIICKLFKICYVFSILGCSHSRNRKYINVCNILCLLINKINHIDTINYGLSIRHNAHSCKSASCSGSGSCSYCLFIFISGFPEMYMQIYKSRHYKTSSRIYYIVCFFLDILIHFKNNSIF